jgi:malonate-semialdehyde dehydrogenase (acetylating)/methylmalonate-semialdehyde dehydrogenase
MRIMLKLQALIREHSKRIAVVLSAEQGKTIADAEGDIFRGLEVVEHACSIGTLQMGEFAENVAGGVDTYTLRQPIGVCAGITPFNFPAMIPLWMFPMAIACGNTFVLKPSEQDPLSTMLLVELALEAGVPAGVLNVVHGGKDVVDALCTHKDIKAVSFVGSTAVGTHVYDLAGKHGKRVQSMMGAKNHAVVLPDANREHTSMRWSVPVSARRASVAWPPRWWCWWARPAMAAGSEGAGAKAQGQCRQRAGTDVGPVISKRAKARILELIESGIKEGAKLELDGRDIKVPGYEQGNFVGPTLFSGVTTDMQIYTQEIFGPVLVVLEVDTLDEAIALVNANPFGNGTGLFTQSGRRRASSRAKSTSARSASTSRSRCRCRSSASPARAVPSSATSARTASKWCSSTPRPKPSPAAGSMTTRQRRREHHHQPALKETTMKIAFIGLGNMGAPMARNLIKAGHGLNLFDLNKTVLAELAELGGQISASPVTRPLAPSW